MGNARMNGRSPRRTAAGHRPLRGNRLTVIISDDIAVGEGDDAPAILRLIYCSITASAYRPMLTHGESRGTGSPK